MGRTRGIRRIYKFIQNFNVKRERMTPLWKPMCTWTLSQFGAREGFMWFTTRVGGNWWH
jgi:hypothetical protein